MQEHARAPLRDEHVVAASFVRLGHPFDPRRLPNRRVPRLSTAPDHRVVVSKNMNPPHVDEPDAGQRPPQAVLDRLARVGDRAQVFAELDTPEQEGSADGVEGADLNAHEGDVYLGQFVMFFRRGWSTPTTIPDDVLHTLSAQAAVSITADGHIADFSIATSSGDPDFDESIMARLQALKEADATIPSPPAAVQDQYFGRTRSLRFNGRDAN